jgi:hypothetical protein
MRTQLRGEQEDREEQDVPWVMQLLVVLKVVVDWALCLYAIPLWLIMLVSQTMVCNQFYPLHTIKTQSISTYLFLAWIPRFLVTTLFLSVSRHRS